MPHSRFIHTYQCIHQLHCSLLHLYKFYYVNIFLLYLVLILFIFLVGSFTYFLVFTPSVLQSYSFHSDITFDISAFSALFHSLPVLSAVYSQTGYSSLPLLCLFPCHPVFTLHFIVYSLTVHLSLPFLYYLFLKHPLYAASPNIYSPVLHHPLFLL